MKKNASQVLNSFVSLQQDSEQDKGHSSDFDQTPCSERNQWHFDVCTQWSRRGCGSGGCDQSAGRSVVRLMTRQRVSATRAVTSRIRAVLWPLAQRVMKLNGVFQQLPRVAFRRVNFITSFSTFRTSSSSSFPFLPPSALLLFGSLPPL